jgi:Holliday junction resolvase RusA-like endonuclease
MYEKRLGIFAYEVMREKHLERFSGQTPLECELQAFYPIPKSENKATKQKMQSGVILPVRTPDCDNVMKIVLDALKGICYEDDDQICNVIFSKIYGEISKIVVAIREIIGR